MSLDNLFAKPQLVQGINDKSPIEIYPIEIKNYNKFQTSNHLIYISRGHFKENDYPLLNLIFSSYQALNMTQEQLINELCNLFSLVTRSEVVFGNLYGIDGFVVNKNKIVKRNNKKYLINKKNIISAYNYEEIRSVIMNQNIMFEQKIYKSKITQEWAELALQERMKNQPKIGMEEMLSTVSVHTGKHYWDLDNYSIYQIYTDFYRIRKHKNYDNGILANCQGAGIDIEDFAEHLVELYKNPYDSLFVDNDTILNKFKK